MQITLIAVGKLREIPLKAFYEEYRKRLQWKITLQEIEGKSTALENKLLLETIPHPSFIIALDEKGENLKSDEFAHFLKDLQLHHQGKATFLIGGANGLSQELKAKANKMLSFGRMTWPHQLARILLMEQLYRAQQILCGHPYHRA
jgi:23S rRNA (pseudouridine1915-N3)-methyltransferase